MYYVGIDIGGTTIAAGIVDDKLNWIAKSETSTGQCFSGDELIEKIVGIYNDLLSTHHITVDMICSVGIGVPGTANQVTGEVEDADNLGLGKYPFLTKIKERIRTQVYMENDANTAALGEYQMGRFQAKSFFMVTLGTGIGGGYIVDGKILTGINGALGEIGHMVIDYKGRPCNCGRKGCFEQYASARALVRDAECEVRREKQGLLWKKYIDNQYKLNGKLLFEAYRMKDETACKIVENYISYLEIGITNIINILQPDILCFGGGISQASDCFMKQLQKCVQQNRYSRNSDKNTEIIAASHGNEAGIMGAALLGMLH